MWRLALHRPYSPPRRAYKDWSEKRRGGTSERRKDREPERKVGRKKEMGVEREGPQALASLCPREWEQILLSAKPTLSS